MMRKPVRVSLRNLFLFLQNMSFAFSEVMLEMRILSRHEGRTRGRHDTRGGDAVGVSGRSVISLRGRTYQIRTVKSCGPGIPTLMPSWRRCLRIAPATVAKSPAHRGEHEAAVKTIARGRPGVLG
jgi:hypothetical protein